MEIDSYSIWSMKDGDRNIVEFFNHLRMRNNRTNYSQEKIILLKE
jgi:hypothetical protein